MKNDFFEKPEFACLGKEKIAFLKELAQKSKGKSPMELMAMFEQYQNKFSQGKPLQEEEKKAILIAIRESLDDSEKKRFDYVVNMLF